MGASLLRPSDALALRGDAPAHVVPRLLQLLQRRGEHRLRVAPDLDRRPVVGLADDMAVLAQTVAAQRLGQRLRQRRFTGAGQAAEPPSQPSTGHHGLGCSTRC